MRSQRMNHQTQAGHGIGESIRVAQTNIVLHSGSLACACGRDGQLHA